MEEPKYLAKMSLLLLEINSIQKRFSDKGYLISSEGVVNFDSSKEIEMSKSILTNMNKIIDILKLLDDGLFQPTNTYNICSYAIKHIIEGATFSRILRNFPSLNESFPCSYVSNGIAIICLILHGYDFKFPRIRNLKKPTDPNILFKVKADKTYNK